MIFGFVMFISEKEFQFNCSTCTCSSENATYIQKAMCIFEANLNIRNENKNFALKKYFRDEQELRNGFQKSHFDL